MHDNKPVISSITACYNSGKYFKEALEGLIKQTVHLDNIIVVDDCSTDDSWEILKETAREYFNILENNNDDLYKGHNGKTNIILKKREKNGGPAACRNSALDLCLEDSDIICVCDCDDVYYPTKVQKSIEVMKKYPSIGLVYSDYDILDERTGKKATEFKEMYSDFLLFNECIVSNNSIIDANLLRAIGTYDESIYGPEDYDLWLRLSEKSAVYHIPEPLYIYRLTGQNLTIATKQMKLAINLQKVHKKKIERRQSA